MAYLLRAFPEVAQWTFSLKPVVSQTEITLLVFSKSGKQSDQT